MRRSALFGLCFLLILTGLSAPAAAKRVALVIGNDSYENVTDLQKAVNDARAIGSALQSIGFDVLRGENVSRREMNNQLQSFAAKLETGDEAVFFFAGHGVGIEGRNFLLPVDAPDAKPGQEDFVEAEAVSAERVLDTIRRRGARVAILVLDACRDNPFQREGTRSLGGSRGLARMDASKGTFIIYSADIGQTALDRLSNSDADPNSVFTRNLVPMLKRPGLSLPQMARDVRAEVEKLALGVSHDQRPAYYDGITGEFFFAGEGGEAAAKAEDTPLAAPAPLAPPPADNSVELAFWNSVQSSDSAEAVQEYLTRFPSGAFAGLAKIRLKALEQKQAALPLAQEAAPAQSGETAPVTECDRLAAAPRDTEKLVSGVGVDELDGPKAIAACRAAIEQYPKTARLHFQLGRALLADKQHAEAARVFRTAADLGNVLAMHNLGVMYDKGEGVAKDDGEAVRWSRKAADLGEALAMVYLGNMYAKGSGVAKDGGEAARWWRKAADLGEALAMVNLGWMYENGVGVAKDRGEAARWYRKAAELGNADAIKKLAGQ